MKRLHVSLAVSDLDKSVRFYATLFGAEPTVLKGDYAKWMLEDPRVNFAISSVGASKGFDHLGIQVEDEAELAAVTARLSQAGRSVVEQKAATCCYARSDKAWVRDPEGIAWETFRTFGESDVYGPDRQPDAKEADAAGRSSPAGAPSAKPGSAASCCAP
jgi:catechol 2,3-dioxygenase-like lactoylglutathione lyase family enzyme